MSGNTLKSLDFDRLIRERRDEKKLSSMRKQFQKIWTIRTRGAFVVHATPFPEGAFELLLSNRILEKVLAYLTEPTDLTSAYFACATFAEILEKRRMLLLLPKVLYVYRMNIDKQQQKWLVENEENRRVRNNVCLNFRQVCKAWKGIADFELFDSDFENSEWFLNADWINDCYLTQSRIVCKLWDNEEEDNVDQEITFFRQFEAPTCIIRNINLSLYEEEPEDGISAEYFRKIINFLQVHGRAVQSLCFRWQYPTNMAILHERLAEMLESVPNLKALVLCLYIREEIMEEQEDDFDNFQLRLNQQRPFPVLDSLKHFECIFEFQPDERLSRQILQKCANLKSVSYIGSPYHEDLIVTEDITEALMSLRLERYEGYAITITSYRVTWPLKHLTIAREYDSVMASELFPAINRFQETLQYLMIWPKLDKDTDNVRLDLPDLRTLTLQRCTYGGTLGFDFDDVLHLKSLERISVPWEMRENENSKVKIKQYRDTDEMEKSNVWECFSHLKCLQLAGACFYRPLSPS